MAEITPQLKRKREGADSQRKKPKTQRKGVAGIENENETATSPAVKSTPKANATPKKRRESFANSQTLSINGTTEDTPTGTPSSSKDKKDLKGKKTEDIASTPTQNIGTEVEEALVSSIVDDGRTEETSTSIPLSKKQKKKERRKEKDQKKQSVGVIQTNTADESALQVSGPTKSKKKGKASTQWAISPPQGGWFLPRDPVFSSDEKYLILANLRALQVYSTETSLLTSVLPVGGSGVLSAYALSSSNANLVYIADSNGLITLWDWVNGSKIGRWEIGSNVRHLAVVTQPDADEDLVYCHEVGNAHILNVHALRTKSQASKTELKRILKTSSSIAGIQVLLQGKIVVVACTNSVMIGKRQKLSKTALQDFEYTWREFKTSKRVTTFSAYIRNQEDSSKSKKQSQDPRDNLDLAIGDETGVIYLFEDILSSFAAMERNQNVSLEGLRPKRLHWHRDAVGSIKWSLDGNYLISGGDETVLTIWQLSTGNQQHLPHLTAAIENVVVSPSGASYALTLANNSIIVLSTTELRAKTNIIGIQSRRVDLEQQPRDSNSSKYSFDIFGQVPLAVDPKNPSQVIFAIPSSQPLHANLGLQPEPYIQTFDVGSNRPVSRQALTRNNATDPNMGPEGRRILEPNVKLLQISYDGEWLATVDEWIPPRTDMGYLNEGVPQFNEEERTYRREVYLKFWRWDKDNAQWKLEARIDAPHFFENVCASGRVFDLVADPSAPGFATVGEDHCVRIWRPKTRLRDGVVVRGADKSKGLVTWSLDRMIEISSKLDVLESNAGSQQLLPIRTSRLGFSSDGSVLAAGVSWVSESDHGVIHLIDANAGAIRRSITELDITALSGLGVAGRHLVVLGDSINVWDMVLDQLAYCIPIDSSGVDRFERIPLMRLAINAAHGTFAVSCPQFEKNETSKSRSTRYFKKATSKVSIFDPEHMEVLWTSRVPSIILALTPQKDGRGYIALDASSSIRIVNPKARGLQLLTPPPEPTPQRITDVDRREATEIKEGESVWDQGLLPGSEELLQGLENDKPVVRPEQLQQIFDDGASHALPPVKDLFNAVIGLYSRKPRTSAGTVAKA